MSPDYIILRGAPGSGKSTVARALATRLQGSVTIETDVIRGMIHGVRWDDVAQHMDAIEATATAAKTFRSRGYQPILVDTLGFGSLEVMLKALGEIDCIVFSLVCAPWLLRCRLFWRARGYKDGDRAVRFNQHILDDVQTRQTVFDTTRMCAGAVADHMMERLR